MAVGLTLALVAVILVVVLLWDAMGSRFLHGTDLIQWLLLPPFVGAFVSWIVLRTVDFMFGGPQRRRSS